MAWQKYQVPCACGIVHEVSAGSAGSTFACACGKTVEVPSLVKLKASVGQSTVSADFELDQMIGSNALPVEDTCGVCGLKTDYKMRVAVVCERAEEKKDRRADRALALGCLFGWIGLLIHLCSRSDRPAQTVGRNVAYHLPIRVCSSCAAGRWTANQTRAVLDRTPLYARLLDKYHDAQIGTPG